MPVSELWEPTPAEYAGLYPTVCLTPSLVQPMSPRLAHRASAYAFGKFLGDAERCQWFEGRALAASFGDCRRDFAVDIKLLLANWATDLGKLRLVREVFALEQCRTCCPHVIRIVDMFMGSVDSVPRICLVFEALGLSMDRYRFLQGYDRYGSQPCHHLRRCLLHVGSALQHLHCRLGLVHASVRLNCIIVTEAGDSLSRGITCLLSGLTSLEEANACDISGRRVFFFLLSQGRRRQCVVAVRQIRLEVNRCPRARSVSLNWSAGPGRLLICVAAHVSCVKCFAAPAGPVEISISCGFRSHNQAIPCPPVCLYFF